MADIDWSLAKTPLTITAPVSGGVQAANGAILGAQAGVAPQMASAGLQQQQAAANVAPQMAQAALSSSQIDNAQKGYSMAQNILAPSMMALRNNDPTSAANIYNNGISALKKAGVDTQSLGAPDQFNPQYVQYAFNNVQQQMALLQQMQQMQVSQSTIGKNNADIASAASSIAQTNYNTGANMPLPGGQAPDGVLGGYGSNMGMPNVGSMGLQGLPSQGSGTPSTPNSQIAGALQGGIIDPTMRSPNGTAQLPTFAQMQADNGAAGQTIMPGQAYTPSVTPQGTPATPNTAIYTGLNPLMANANLPPKVKADALAAQINDFTKTVSSATGAAADASANIPLITEAKQLVKGLTNIGPFNSATASLRPDVQRLDSLYNRMFTGNLAGFTATTHVNRLDIPIANALHNITPKISDAASTQIKNLDTQANVSDGVILSGYIANKLKNMGVSDPDVLNNVKNMVGDQIYGKDGTVSTPGIYDNGQKVADKVIAGLVKGQPLEANSNINKPSTPTNNLPTLAEAVASGHFTNAIAAKNWLDSKTKQLQQ